MSLRIRLARGGAKKRPFYRIVVADSRMPRERLPAPGEDEFYHADLLGLRVVDSEGRAAGTVHALHDFGAGDLIEIRRPSRRLVLLPFTRTAVPHIDLAAGEVTVDAVHLAEAEAPAAAEDDR